MAMIKCPECGRDISDTAKSCPGCGFHLNDSCLEECSEIPQKVEPKKTSAPAGKKIIIPICIVLCAIVLVGVFAAIKQRERKQYLVDAEAAYMRIWTGSFTAEQTGSMIYDEWYYAINSQDSYGSGVYNSTASRVTKALNDLYNSERYKKNIKTIDKCRTEAEELLEKLDNPPDGYEDIYEDLKTYYVIYTQFADVVNSPSGSLTTFTDALKDVDSRSVRMSQKVLSYFEPSSDKDS